MTSRPARSGPRLTMEDVARQAGVSAMTVSRALRRPDLVSEGTRARILALIERLGYVPDQWAGTLSSRQSGFIATIIPSLNNSNFADTVRGLTDVLHGRGLQLLVGFSDYSVAREEEMVATMLKRRPEGVVLAGAHTQQTPRARHLLRQAGIPVIETWDIPEDPLDHVVGFSNFEAALLMVRHLADRGYRRIAFLGGAGAEDTRDSRRLAGYEAGMAERGLEPRSIGFGQPPATMDQGGAAVALLLERHPETEAVICVSDLLAFGVLGTCLRRGLAVPQRLAIAGFGDFDVSRASCPTITTIRVGAYEIGVQAGELMLATLERLRAGETVAPTVIRTRLTIVPREST